MYHTQECRWSRPLSAPIWCERKDAWLGRACYFWADEVDAFHWGHKSKKATGSFDIYKAKINCSDVLDTVFNEKHYVFWKTQIEKVARQIAIKTGKKASIREINEFIAQKAMWASEIDGILFQDLPNSDDLLVFEFYYRKRIQLALFNIRALIEFSIHEQNQQC